MEVLDKPVSVVAEYEPFYAQLATLEADNKSLAFDYESKKGNKEARSHVNSLRLTKGALERTRKAAKEESLKIGRAVDAEAKVIEARIEAMIAVHQMALDAIEQREKDRVAAHMEKLASLKQIHAGQTVSAYNFHIDTLERVVIDDKWEEFIAEAAAAKDASIAEHRRLRAERQTADDEAAELSRLREEAAARAQKDREEAIAKAAVERAAAEAEKRSRAEREAAERRELELKYAAENAERRRVEAEQKAAKDAQDAVERAEREKVQAVAEEKARVAAAAKAEADALAKREANKAHRGRINRAALAALVAGGITEDVAKLCITLIANGEVPAVSIAY